VADGGYDGQAILPKANQVEIRPVIRPKKKRKYRRMTTQIETKDGRESKMHSGILNGV